MAHNRQESLSGILRAATQALAVADERVKEAWRTRPGPAGTLPDPARPTHDSLKLYAELADKLEKGGPDALGHIRGMLSMPPYEKHFSDGLYLLGQADPGLKKELLGEMGRLDVLPAGFSEKAPSPRLKMALKEAPVPGLPEGWSPSGR